MKRSIFIALWLGSIAASPLQAQKDTTLTRTVVVENEYNPNIMDANKINVLPRIEEPSVTKKEIEYARTEKPFSAFKPYSMSNFAPMPMQTDATRGWVNLGYGNYGNLLGRISYLYSLGKKDNLHVSAAFDGQHAKLELPDSKEKWSSRFYQTQINAHYSHRFRQAELGVKGSFGLQTFNYLPYAGQLSDKQDNTTGNMGIYLRSALPDHKWQYTAGVDFTFFGQKYFYFAQESGDGRSETGIHANAGVSYQVSAENKLGLDIEINHYNYSQDDKTYTVPSYTGGDRTTMLANLSGTGLNGMNEADNNAQNTISLPPFENYTLFRLNPYYALTQETLRLRIGAQIDWSTGFDSGIKIAPDVLVEFPFSESYIFYIQGKGGVMPSDFRRMNALSPYWAAIQQLKNTHMQLDATVGFKAGISQGFNLHLFGGYELCDDDLLVIPDSYGPNMLTQDKANSVKGGLSANYLYKDLISVSAQAVYHSWSTDKDNKSYLYTKPAFDLRLNVTGKVEKLNWEAGYQYTSRYKGEMEAINDLYLSLSYPLLENTFVWVKADNLFNRSYQYYWGYPTEKINFMLGANLRF